MKAVELKNEIIAEIGKKAFEKAVQLTCYKNYPKIEDGFEFRVVKLSDFYNSRTTNYASCLNNSPFSISRETEIIVDAGFSKLCKAIITIDKNLLIAQKILEFRKLKEVEREEKNKIDAEKQKRRIENTEKMFPVLKESIIEHLKRKYENLDFSHREANSATWYIGMHLFKGNFDQVTLRNSIKDLRQQC